MASPRIASLSPRPNHNDNNAPLMKLPSMQGGSGHDSYSNNSQVQNYNFHAHIKSHLAEAVQQCALFGQPAAATLRIADFGCSHGRNTVDCAEFVVEQIQKRHGVLAPEIQYFFSDLPTNDFNSLFQVLKPSEKETGDQKLRQLYGAGVPGSFYTRLLPAASLDFAISLYSLHWLSQVPPPVLDKNAPAWNGGHIWIHDERPQVAEAYSQQFQADFKRFLNCRAQELSKGAVLFISSISRTTEHPKEDYYKQNHAWIGYIESTWDEMVSEGVVGSEERDMFNLPLYYFHRAEIETALKDVPELELLKLEVLENRPNRPNKELQQVLNDSQRLPELLTDFIRALIKPMIQIHIGDERTAEFFKRLHRNIGVKASLGKTSTSRLHSNVLIAVLRRL